MDETNEIRRKRLHFRSWHRGTREVDLLLGPFADAHLTALSAAQLEDYETLLQENDGDLYDWITGRSPPPPGRDSEVLRIVMNHSLRPRPA